MTDKAKNALLIVITRTHTHKDEENDEYVAYWDGRSDKAEGLDTNFLDDVCDFLLVHGHYGMQNDIKAAIKNVLKEKKFEISNWKQVYCFVHARKEYKKQIEEIPNIGDHVYEYGSRGTNLTPQDLLEQIKIKLKDGPLSNYMEEILYKIKEKLQGFRYKQHLLYQVKELLLRLRFNMEVFAGNLNETIQKEASKDIEEVKKKIRDILDMPPLKPQLDILYDDMTSKQRLLSFFSAGLDKTSEEYALLKAGNFWSNLLSNEFFARWSKEKKLPEIAEDFKLLSESVEFIMQCIKYNHGHAVSSK